MTLNPEDLRLLQEGADFTKEYFTEENEQNESIKDLTQIMK